MTKLWLPAIAVVAIVTPHALAVDRNAGSSLSYAEVKSLVLIAAPAMSKAELAGLVGHSVRNSEGQKIGNIEGIYVNRDGTVKQVIVGVGGFLGIGDHDVALSWDNLHFSES
jgi:sporulation protein YlmC with PRC-barrel domain